MKLEYAPLAPQPAAKENIILNGRIIGTVDCEIVNGAKRFMAFVDYPYRSGACSGASIGFGATHEAAIDDALRIGIEAAANMLEQLTKIKGEVETNG